MSQHIRRRIPLYRLPFSLSRRLRNEDDVPAWTGTVAPDILAASLRRTQELEALQDVAPHPLQVLKV